MPKGQKLLNVINFNQTSTSTKFESDRSKSIRGCEERETSLRSFKRQQRFLQKSKTNRRTSKDIEISRRSVAHQWRGDTGCRILSKGRPMQIMQIASLILSINSSALSICYFICILFNPLRKIMCPMR